MPSIMSKEFDEVQRLLAAARKCTEMAKNNKLGLGARLAFQKQANELRSQALAIGRQEEPDDEDQYPGEDIDGPL